MRWRTARRSPVCFPQRSASSASSVLPPFFRALQDLLLSAAPAGHDVPHVVLLTPGPYNETFFEHTYLAKHLGFPLVEGSDLTVRDDRVFLKTVAGLQPVHAILRRLDDDYCDPLELRTESALGVPGLVQAWRAGNVLVANAFGTGLLESPALLSMLPSMCERLLGEPLQLASVDAAWNRDWCDTAATESLLAHRAVKPAFPDTRDPTVLGPGSLRRSAVRGRSACRPNRNATSTRTAVATLRSGTRTGSNTAR